VGVIEAMSCGCTPIITERGALPEVVGNIGFYVPYGDEKATAEAVKKALYATGILGEKARERIKELFSLQKRERELYQVIKGL
jgi:glycosyltransferase involved in cell wall biosynthesis